MAPKRSKDAVVLGNNTGHKFSFRQTAGSTPMLVVPSAARLGLVLFNEGPSPLRIGTPSGTLSTLGLLLPSGTLFVDNLSGDEWWMSAPAGSGTVTGYQVM